MAAAARPGDLISLVGDLGAGKTQFAKGFGGGLGVTDTIVSPSFVLMAEYRGRLPMFHIDLYRLDRINEIADLGLDDYLYGDGVCVIEWAEKGLSLLPREHLLVEISYLGDNERRLKFKPLGRRYQKMMTELKSHYE